MNHSDTLQTRTVSISDALINGLLGGVVAGLGMLLWLLLSGLLAGDSPLAVLDRFLLPGQPPNAISSVFLHLGVSAVYGGLFGILLRSLPGGLAGMRRNTPAKMLAGLAFGMLLFLLARAVILPGIHSPLAELSSLALASAHLVYGALLGAVTRV